MNKKPSFAARPVTIGATTLNQLRSLAKPQRKFVAALIATILALRGRVNYRNLARYGNYSERAYARQFGRPFPWLEYHAKTIQLVLPVAHELIAAQDASFIPKSGKKTYGLDKFYNSCAAAPNADWKSARSLKWMSRKRAPTSPPSSRRPRPLN